MLQLTEETRGSIPRFGSSPGSWRNLFCACERFGGEAAKTRLSLLFLLAAFSSKTFLARTILLATQVI